MRKKKTLDDIEKHIEDNPELKPYIEFSNLLAGKLAWYHSFNDKERTYMRYAEFRFLNDLTVPEAFDALKEELLRRGKNPEAYGLKDDSGNFNRAFTKSKFVLNNDYIKGLKKEFENRNG